MVLFFSGDFQSSKTDCLATLRLFVLTEVISIFIVYIIKANIDKNG